VSEVFERFTDRARSVLTLAQEEARLMNHGFIGTEHILLGLIREDEGVSGTALKNLGVSYGAARDKVEEVIGLSGAMPSGSPPFTPRAKKVLEFALREALQLGDSYIGTEHILLGIVREGDGVATTVLNSLGANPTRVRHEMIELMAGASGEAPNVRKGDVAITGRSSASSGPCCPHCRSSVTDEARFRTVSVPADVDDAEGEPVTIDVVYCGQCGSTLCMLKPD